MKKNFTYLLLLLLLGLTTACIKKPKIANVGPIFGVFTGQLVVIHNPSIPKNDTLKANLQLNLSTLIGYSVGGDTSTIQAGSSGSFSVGTDTLNFTDVTYPGPPNSKKLHLNGTYLYSWDGTNLEIAGRNDTSYYTYSFKQISTQQ